MAWDDPLDFKKEGIVLDYKTAGVDIDAGNKFVEKLREKAPGIGGFGGMIKIPSGSVSYTHLTLPTSDLV